MNYLFIISPTESVLTKRGRRHPNIALYLSSKGWNVEYISTTFNHAEKSLFTNEELEMVKNQLPYSISFINVGGYNYNISFKRIRWNQKLAISTYKKLKSRIKKNDIILLPSRPPELIYAAINIKKKVDCQIVLDIRDIWPDALSASSGILRKSFEIYCNYFLNRSLNYIDEFIHVAPSFTKWLQRYVPEAKSSFIPLGYDDKRWDILKKSNKEYNPSKIKLVYSGLLSYQFDIKPVLEAIKPLAEQYEFTIIGDNGTGDRYNDIYNFIKDNRLDQSVKIVGVLPPEEFVNEYIRHDIAIVPMVSGALPNKFFDSIAAGLPILSLGKGDSSDLVEKNNIGWIADFNKSSVFEVLRKITINDIKQKSEYIERIKPEFSQTRLFEKFENILNETISSKA